MADGKSYKAMSEAALDATLDATEKARQDALGLAQQEEGPVTLQDGTQTGKPSAYRSQQDAAEAAGAAGEAAEAAGVAQEQTQGLLASTSGEGITDEWLLTKLPATQITGAPTGDDYPILWPEGTTGTYSIERDSGGKPTADVHTHEASGATVTRPVLRGEDGRAIGYDTPQITRA